MTLKTTLIDAAERHCRFAGISKARLASIVVNDGKFFDRIERGGSFTAKTYERFMAHFARADARRSAALEVRPRDDRFSGGRFPEDGA